MKALRVCWLKLNFISTDMMCRGKCVSRGWFGQFNLIVSMAYLLVIWRLFENSFAEQSISERGSPSAAWKAKQSLCGKRLPKLQTRQSHSTITADKMASPGACCYASAFRGNGLPVFLHSLPDTPFKGLHIVSQDLRPLVLLTALPAV